jgi:hypothetical protein
VDWLGSDERLAREKKYVQVMFLMSILVPRKLLPERQRSAQVKPRGLAPFREPIAHFAWIGSTHRDNI